jgi:hypothetical protein
MHEAPVLLLLLLTMSQMRNRNSTQYMHFHTLCEQKAGAEATGHKH